MIKITIELWPFGAESKKKVIGEGKIANDGTGDHWIGNYVYVWRYRNRETGEMQLRHAGRVGNFPRSNDVLDLIYDTLDNMIEEEMDMLEEHLEEASDEEATEEVRSTHKKAKKST